MRRNDWTKILGRPGYAVYEQEIDEKAKILKLLVRRKRGNRRLICSSCGRRIAEPTDTTEREVRDLPWGEFRTTVVIELHLPATFGISDPAISTKTATFIVLLLIARVLSNLREKLC